LSPFDDAEAARSRNDISAVDIGMTVHDHRTQARGRCVVLREGEHDEVAAQQVLALAAEGKDGLRLHQRRRMPPEGAVLSPSLRSRNGSPALGKLSDAAVLSV
jgi:hypothetical protein